MATRSAGVRRLMREAAELSLPTDMYVARPLEDNLFEWHFTIRGPSDSAFEGGIYHGRIIIPHDYPMKPPSFMMLTPTGRFETHTKICLSISAYHPETWLPSWSIGTALTALIAFMTTPAKGALGGLDCSDEQRKKMAKESLKWKCSDCGCEMKEIFDIMQQQATPRNSNPAGGDCNSSLREDVSSHAAELPQPDPITVEPASPEATLPTPQSDIQSSSPNVPRIALVRQQQAVAVNSSSTGLLIFIFSAIFFALLYRRLNSIP